MSEINFEAIRAWYTDRLNTQPSQTGVWHEQAMIDGVLYDITVTVRGDRTTGIKIEAIKS